MTTIQDFNFSVNLLQALLWQYNDAENLQALLQNKQDWFNINQKEFWENWIRDVFDLRTANDFGLSVWSIILDLPLYIGNGVDSPSKPSFGFGVHFQNFGHGNFSTVTGGISSLPVYIKRLALRLRYYQLTTAGTVPEINRMLADLFQDRGRAYLLDNHDMTQTYVFDFALESALRYMFDNLDVLPKPAGVGSSYMTLTNKPFGFSDKRENFHTSNFYH